jgi:hypothetical protein
MGAGERERDRGQQRAEFDISPIPPVSGFCINEHAVNINRQRLFLSRLKQF